MNFKKAFKLLISSCLGALILIFIFNNAKININGVELAISLKPAFRGFTAIILPPLGNVKAYTHVLPVRLNIELKNIDIDLLKTLIYKSQTKRAVGPFQRRNHEILVFIRPQNSISWDCRCFLNGIYIEDLKEI